MNKNELRSLVRIERQIILTLEKKLGPNGGLEELALLSRILDEIENRHLARRNLDWKQASELLIQVLKFLSLFVRL